MKKINFENAEIINPAKVTIEGIDYEVTPSQLTVIEKYLSAETLNEMQDNIEESCVIVSPTEPTTNEKVWLQKGKNLFNSNSIIWFTNCTNNNGTIIQSTADTNIYLRWKTQTFLNGNYVSNLEVILKNDIGKVSFKFTKDNSFNQIAIGLNGTTIDTLVALDISDLINGEAYVISFEIINTTQGSVSWNNIQIEQGSTATDYEKYIEKKIYCKNDNGGFEEFVNAEPKGIETIKNDKGTTIKFPDGTMICRGKSFIPSNTVTATVNFPSAFINSDYDVVITGQYANSRMILYNATPYNELAFVVHPVDTYSNDTPTVEGKINYIAIGRWK